MSSEHLKNVKNAWDDYYKDREKMRKAIFGEGEKQMKRIAMFEKVSYEQFRKDYIDTFCSPMADAEETEIQAAYDSIKLPIRKTTGSAGYDFSSPYEFELKAGHSIKIPTGIRCRMDEGWVLKIYPRSSLGFKYRCQIDNTVPIIDADYFYSDNKGHIFIKLTNDSRNNKDMKVSIGDGIVQGIFVEFGITEDDNATGIRNGGIGSTGKQ